MTMNSIKTDPIRTRKVVQKLIEWYKIHDGIFTGYLPESKPPNGVSRGSYEHIMFLTLSVSLDYQRSANDLWDSARKTWESGDTSWVFSPKKVEERDEQDLVDALAKHKLSRKRNKDAKIWRRVSLSFLKLFDGDPRKLFEKYDYDAVKIFNAMRTQYGKEFPYLAGSTGTQKICSLWIRMLKDEASVKFKNLNNVPIPIDIHTARSTVTTGCVSGRFDGSFSDLTDLIKKAWVEACTGMDYYPLQLDEPLWNLSRFGCSKHINGSPCPVRQDCRLSEFCTANHPDSIISIKQNENTHIDTKFPESE